MLLCAVPVIDRTTRYGNRWGMEYDTDCTRTISREGPTSMPKSPGSTPSTETIDSCHRMQMPPLRPDTGNYQLTSEDGTGYHLECALFTGAGIG